MVSVAARLTMTSLRASRSKGFYADPAVMRQRLSEHQRMSMTRPTWSPTVRTRMDVHHKIPEARSARADNMKEVDIVVPGMSDRQPPNGGV